MGFDILGAGQLAAGAIPSLVGLYDRYRMNHDPLLQGIRQTQIGQYNNAVTNNPYGDVSGSWGGLFGYHAPGATQGTNGLGTLDPSSVTNGGYDALASMFGGGAQQNQNSGGSYPTIIPPNSGGGNSMGGGPFGWQNSNKELSAPGAGAATQPAQGQAIGFGEAQARDLAGMLGQKFDWNSYGQPMFDAMRNQQTQQINTQAQGAQRSAANSANGGLNAAANDAQSMLLESGRRQNLANMNQNLDIQGFQQRLTMDQQEQQRRQGLWNQIQQLGNAGMNYPNQYLDRINQSRMAQFGSGTVSAPPTYYGYAGANNGGGNGNSGSIDLSGLANAAGMYFGNQNGGSGIQ